MAQTSNPPSASRLLFAGRLREERRAQGLTLEGLAAVAGLSWNYVGQVERGVRNISVDNMDVLARALGLPLSQLLSEKLRTDSLSSGT